jgi:hypothetical protein
MPISSLLFGGTIFSSAFLLFLVQPLMAKQILPWFGGSAAVWTVCLVFFQVVLLAGYAYADLLTRRCSPRTQSRVHAVLLLASLASLPIIAGEAWKPADANDPTLRILGLLVATIGLPYFVVCTTGPLLQAWVARSPAAARVYRYFSLSNFASLLALLAYPVAIEPWWPLRTQALGWSAAYSGFIVLCLGSAWLAAREPRNDAAPAAEPTPPSPPGRAADAGTQALWLLLPALGSWLLLAVTNHITQHVASIPFLWVLPLATYLFTFILCFESDRWYRRGLVLPLAAALLLLAAYGLTDRIGTAVTSAVPLYVGALFVLCMALHGEMARLRPPPQQLTRYYLMLSAGGALGGVMVGLVAPQLLDAYYELGIGLVLTAVLGVVVLRGRRFAALASAAVALVCAGFVVRQVVADHDGARRVERNFYGTLQSYDTDDAPQERMRILRHGSVMHGEQFVAMERRREPTAYYGPSSGVGRALALLPPGRPARVGLVGLGAGTLAVYGRARDTYRLYEIDPQVFELARSEFSFLGDAAARGVRFEDVPGDARLSMEREPPQQFDVLAVDAFSGGAVPVHLITTEALQVYMRHVKPDGVLAFHLTNRFLQLPPVVLANAQALGLHAVLVRDDAEQSEALRRTDWVLVSRDAALLQQPTIAEAAVPPPSIPGLRPWTDDFNNLLQILK